MEWDLIIIGGGPGGYVAAEQAAHHKLKVLLVEKNHMGGVCLNEGCVPTKTMLNSAHFYEKLQHNSVEGIDSNGLKLDHEKLQEWKNAVVSRFRTGVESLMKGNSVTVVKGKGKFFDAHTIEVNGEKFKGKNIIIATGSSPIVPPIPGIDQSHVFTSTEFLDLTDIPSPFAVIGGGVIGLEIGSLCAAMGKEVHILEMETSLLGGLRPEISKSFEESLKGCTFHLGTKVKAVEKDKLICENDGKEIAVPAAGVLVSTGRRPNTEDLNLKEVRVATCPRGVAVNERMQASIPGVYAIGDVTGISLLAHAASRMGEVAVNNICGKPDWFDENTIPWVVYTSPEAAGCGLTKEQAKEEGYKPVSAKFKLVHTARFFAENGDAPGWVSLLADKESGRILGIELLGNGSSEMVFGGSLMVQNELTVDDLIATVFPHPTVSEAIRECAFLLKNKLKRG